MRPYLTFLLLVGLLCAQTNSRPPLIVGIDHIPVVVADLEKAQADFRALGFRIKPGHPHADGIRNAHVKFPDGSEIELITAPAAVDALTAEYRAKLASGEGPVYFGLYAPDQTALLAKVKGLPVLADTDHGALDFAPESALHPIFFGQRNKSPTDTPEHFAHENTAVRLSGLWVRDNQEFHALLKRLRVPLAPVRLCGFVGGGAGTVARLPEGNVYLVPSGGANVIAARVEIRSVGGVKTVLGRSGVSFEEDSSCDLNAVWVTPSRAHGIWIEFIGSKE